MIAYWPMSFILGDGSPKFSSHFEMGQQEKPDVGRSAVRSTSTSKSMGCATPQKKLLTRAGRPGRDAVPEA